MSTATTGILAALASPLLLTIGFIIWDKEWSGSAFALNLYKCCLASTVFLIVVVLNDNSTSFDNFVPLNVAYLILSSFIGILVGDTLWLYSLNVIGARRVIIIDTIKPFFAAMLGYLLLDEKLGGVAPFVGITLTAFGVLWVSLEKDSMMTTEISSPQSCGQLKDHLSNNDKCRIKTNDHGDDVLIVVDANSNRSSSIGDDDGTEQENVVIKKNDDDNDGSIAVGNDQRKTPQHVLVSKSRGYIAAILNVVFDTYGSILTKQNGQDMTSWEINLVRFGFAGISLLLITIGMRIMEVVTKKTKSEEDTNKVNSNDWFLFPKLGKKSWIKISCGVGFVTFLCPALSAYALFQIDLALALTLSSLSPLYSLPLMWLMKKEKPTYRSIIGAIVTVLGVCILSIWGIIDDNKNE